MAGRPLRKARMNSSAEALLDLLPDDVRERVKNTKFIPDGVETGPDGRPGVLPGPVIGMTKDRSAVVVFVRQVSLDENFVAWYEGWNIIPVRSRAWTFYGPDEVRGIPNAQTASRNPNRVEAWPYHKWKFLVGEELDKASGDYTIVWWIVEGGNVRHEGRHITGPHKAVSAVSAAKAAQAWMQDHAKNRNR